MKNESRLFPVMIWVILIESESQLRSKEVFQILKLDQLSFKFWFEFTHNPNMILNFQKKSEKIPKII